MARAKDTAELAEYHSAKRDALAAIFIRSQYNKTLDAAPELFIRRLQNLENIPGCKRPGLASQDDYLHLIQKATS